MKTKFEKIYAENVWQHGSGEGSLPMHTAAYRAFLEQFICENRIRSIVDFGCGDWQSSQLINWRDVHYIGFDIVPSVVQNNRIRFSKSNVEFQLFDEDLDSLPIADLLIVKDVIQHWSNEAIIRFLPTLRRYPYSLVTNCIRRYGSTQNRDISDGGFRPLDIRKPPFNVTAQELLTFTNHRTFSERLFARRRWKKNVLLVRSSS